LASRWQALREIADDLVAAPLCHGVKVVEDQHEGQLTDGSGIDQRRQHYVLDRWLRAAEVIGQRGVELQDRIERGDHCREQCDRIVVRGLERNPGERPLVPVSPQGQQRRLAVAGWRGEEDDRDVGHREEAVDQSRTVHDARAERRRRQLAGDDRPAFAGRAESRSRSDISPLRPVDRHKFNLVSFVAHT